MKISFANSSLAMWLTRAVTAFRNRSRVRITETALPIHDTPQITPGWDYRPRSVVRQDALWDGGGVRSSDRFDDSTPKENENVWFNFTNAEPTADQAPITVPLAEDAREV